MITEFSHWIPPTHEKKPLKGVVVLCPPSQSDGRHMIHDLEWRDFAAKAGFALLGCYFQDDNPSGFEEYCDLKSYSLDEGPGGELFEYLETHVDKGQPEIPLYLWGFSAGGQFAYEFACQYPFAVRGFVVNKGGVYYTALAPKDTREIPSLWVIGQKDAEWRQNILNGIFDLNRVAGAAKWVKMVEGVGHQEGLSKKAGIAFFEGIIKGEKK